LRSADFVTGEAYSDWTGLNAPGFFSKFLRGVSFGRPYEVLIGRFLNTWDFTYKSPVQMEFETATIISNGGTVTVDDEPTWINRWKIVRRTIKIFLNKRIREEFCQRSRDMQRYTIYRTQSLIRSGTKTNLSPT
jgi:hypothetical protein